MTTLKPYFYYSKHDSQKDVIDRVIAMSEEDALTYFANRKKLDEQVFKQLYIIELHEETKFEQLR